MSAVLNADQEAALNVMLSGENCFLTGDAGTGKTFVLCNFISQMMEANKNLLICAPTGAAALRLKETAKKDFGIDIDTFTIHRTFKLKKTDIVQRNGRKPSSELIAADIIIIDEISMCRIDLFEYIMNEIYKTDRYRDKAPQLIVCGDFYQLEPVLTDRIRPLFEEEYGKYVYAFDSEDWYIADFHNLILRDSIRTGDDLEFSKHLNRLRTLSVEDDYFDLQEEFDWFNQNTSQKPFEGDSVVTICATNAQASVKNEEMLDLLQTKDMYSTAILRGDAKINDSNAEADLRFKVGAKVMMLVNGSEYVNGDFGKVVGFDDFEEEVLIRIDSTNKVVRVPKYVWSVTKPVTKTERVLIKNPNGELVYGEDGRPLYRIVEKIESEEVGSVEQYPFKLGYAFTVHKSQGMTIKNNMEFQFGRIFANGQLYVALSRAERANKIHLSKHITHFNCKKTTSKRVISFYHAIDAKHDNPV